MRIRLQSRMRPRIALRLRENLMRCPSVAFDRWRIWWRAARTAMPNRLGFDNLGLMTVKGWIGGSTGSPVFGVRVGIPNASRFLRDWKTVELEIDGELHEFPPIG